MTEQKIICECGKDMVEVNSEFEEFGKCKCTVCDKSVYVLKKERVS